MRIDSSAALIKPIAQSLRRFFYLTKSRDAPSSLSVCSKLGRGFHMACEDLPIKETFVVYAGMDEFPINNDVTVVSLPSMLDKLATLS